jgi:hypothetical protein
MISLMPDIQILFGVAAALAFFFPLLKDGVYKQLSVKALAQTFPRYFMVLVPFCAMFGFAAFLGAPVNLTLPSFAGSALLAFVLMKTGLPPFLRGVLLLSGALLFSILLPADGANLAFAASIMGVLVAKISDTLLFDGDRSLEDVIAPLSWLGGVLWLNALEDQGAVPMKQAMLLGTIAVCLILRIVQRPFMTDDRWLVKRVVLATSGGLGVLLVITKLLLATDQAAIALLAGAGIFAAYLFQNMLLPTAEEGSCGTQGVKVLIVIGMLTLIATRFFGMYGLCILAPTALVANRFSFGQFAGVYFLVRSLLQVFITVYNPNVTGINVMHSYTGAAEYAGIIIMACLALIMRDLKDRRVLALLFFGSAAAIPVLSNYYLHAEPTSSLLVASAVGGAIFAALGPALARGEEAAAAPFENLLLLPAMMASVGTAYSGLIDAGNNATNEFKTQILAYVIGAAIVCFIVGYFVSRQSGKGGGTPVPAASE